MTDDSDLAAYELEKLKRELREKDEIIARLQSDESKRLTNEEIERYSRQILVPIIGVEGQMLLKKSSVLVVGAGGLGCPSSLYLAGSGIGHLGIVDYDVVELNNLHRQVLHKTRYVGASKVDSAAKFIRSLNGNVYLTTYPITLDKSNALDVISGFDVVVDATDNVATRYLLNDACILLRKPLVSGSALKTEGQLTVYNHDNGPCYRCLFPVPPPAEAVTNCGDGGVFGPVPGVIGVLQAAEAMKIILKQKSLAGTLLLFDGADTTFRSIKLRPRNPKCDVCGENPTVTKLIDYEHFCGAKSNDKNANVKMLPRHKRMTVMDYKSLENSPHVLIDVRKEVEFKMCRLEGSINIPIDKISNNDSFSLIESEIRSRKGEADSGSVPGKFARRLPPSKQQTSTLTPHAVTCPPSAPGTRGNCSFFSFTVFVICRRGNDSQKAVLELERKFTVNVVKDIIGGLHAWSKEIDSEFPSY